MDKNKITFVMTSCNRFDLLIPTLQSFLTFNTYPVERYIFIEDSNKIKQLQKSIQKFPDVYKKALLLYNYPKLGQIKSIDKAYRYVNTDYIFHCEEDWEFYSPHFIEHSIEVLQENPKIINVWLRDMNDTNGHPIEEKTYFSKKNIPFKLLEVNYLNKWNGFTFNPSVKRISDYKKFTSYQHIGHEAEIGISYYKMGYRAAIFLNGFVKHQGWHRRVLDSDKKRTKIALEIDSWFKKQKASFYKKIGVFGKKYKS